VPFLAAVAALAFAATAPTLIILGGSQRFILGFSLSALPLQHAIMLAPCSEAICLLRDVID
jgi:hypothetical protein